jgi:hypothetical protein
VSEFLKANMGDLLHQATGLIGDKKQRKFFNEVFFRENYVISVLKI